MAKFRIVVKEIVSIKYTVEAEDLDSAIDLVDQGLVAEDELYLDDVYITEASELWD